MHVSGFPGVLKDNGQTVRYANWTNAFHLAGITPVISYLSPSSVPAGIMMVANAMLSQNNQGAYSWVQLLNPADNKILNGNGPQQCATFAGQQKLDTTYPYGIAGKNLFQQIVPNDTVTDNPSLPLVYQGTDAEGKAFFSATIYLMWNSGLQNSIPVPLASLAWSWAADAINTLTPQQKPAGNNTTFALGCGPQCVVNQSQPIIPAAAGPTQGYPTWQTAYTNAALQCQPQ